MTYVLIIRGPLGVGKTTISKIITSKINGYYISIDKTLEIFGLNKIIKEEQGIPLSNFIKVNNLILPEIKKQLINNTSVVIDGNFYHKKQIEHLIKNINYPHFEITLTTSVQTCISRDNKRELSYGKNSTYAVYSMVSKFDYGITIDTTNKTANEVVNKIIQLIKLYN